MAKFKGLVGYLITAEKMVDNEPTGIWEESYIERQYCGDVIRNISRWDKTSNFNDDISVNNSISIVADPFANANFQNIKYVVYMGQKWKVSSIEVSSPRLILSLGGVYNERSNGST